ARHGIGAELAQRRLRDALTTAALRLGEHLEGDGQGGSTLHRGQAALTGPVARGDAAAVGGHLNALDEIDSELAQSYCANSLRTAQRAHAPEEVVDVLTEWSRQAGPHR
nr:DUF2520 domain-containing protein [Mycobacterium sp.]